jgi:hypothetical protein
MDDSASISDPLTPQQKMSMFQTSLRHLGECATALQMLKSDPLAVVSQYTPVGGMNMLSLLQAFFSEVRSTTRNLLFSFSQATKAAADAKVRVARWTLVFHALYDIL